MGTSFTDYRGHGFLTRDAALETVLALLVLELEPLARQDPDLDEILDSWTIQSVAGFIGISARSASYAGRQFPRAAVHINGRRPAEVLPAGGVISKCMPMCRTEK